MLNPFRYRSYYYDTETGLYYLQTRYYDPEIGRFINMDGVDYADLETINGLNLYAYCGNNPVTYVDPSGTFAITIGVALGLAALATALFAVVEITMPPIENAAKEIGDAFGKLINNIGEEFSSNMSVEESNKFDNYFDFSQLETDLLINIRFKDTYDPDPFKRPGQKKQGGELKNKSRKKPGWQPRGGRRRPVPPKKHTLGRDHKRKSFEQIIILLRIIT